MLEQRRLDYLQAMGVTQWMPRVPLANAPEPRWWPTEAANMDEVAESKIEMALPIAQVLAQSANMSSQLEQNIAPKLEVVTTASLSVDAQTVPNIQLFFIECQLPVLWVIDTQDIEQLNSLQRFVFALQKSLLGKAYHLRAPVEFKWPFLQSRTEDQSLPVALRALKVQWDVFANEQLQAICFGAQSQYWLEQAELPVFKAYESLAELLYSADLKRQLWLELPLPTVSE